MLPRREAVQRWIDGRAAFSGARVVGMSLFPGGASNVTCLVELEGHERSRVVLRLQRERGIFEPYDVLREARVHRALGHSRIPVPAVLAEEPDRSHLGAPFVLLEWIDGLHLGEAGHEGDYLAFVQAVAAIHQLDWRSLGLGFLGIPGSAREAVLADLDAVRARQAAFGCDDDAVLSDARERLARYVPGDGHLALCHGDINVFNYLFRARRLAAVVDWEQARIGDPRSDIGQLVALSHLKGAPFAPPRTLPFVRSYEEAAGREVLGLEFFRAFWLFQLGVIHEGWVAFNGTAPWFSRREVDDLLAPALANLD